MIRRLLARLATQYLILRSRLDVWLRRRGHRAIGQYAFNPLRNYPRNRECWCGSYRKAKRCCLPKQARLCPVEVAITLAKYMNEVDKHERGEPCELDRMVRP